MRAGEAKENTDQISREGCKIVNELVQKGEINQEHAKIIEPNYCNVLRLIGYSKIHKGNVPLRGVVLFTGTPYENTLNEVVPKLEEFKEEVGFMYRIRGN